MTMIEGIKKSMNYSKTTSANVFQNHSLHNRKRIYKTHLVLKIKLALFFLLFFLIYCPLYIGVQLCCVLLPTADKSSSGIAQRFNVK